MSRSSDPLDRRADEQIREVGRRAIDWSQFRMEDSAPEQRENPASDSVRESPYSIDAGLGTQRAADDGDAPLLVANSSLDASRLRVPVADLHPSRLEAPSAADTVRLQRAVAESEDPRDWIGLINPGLHDDVRLGRVGRTENCADCARAVQSTLDGSPVPAASIDRAGLPTVDHFGRADAQSGGEMVDYTEHWAGKRAEPSGYEAIEQRLRDTKGSAIVFVAGDSAHATNAMYDAAHDKVLWLDGQLGIVDDWPPPYLMERFPHTAAIFFDPPTHRHPGGTR